jgi:hypothetical protein
MYYITAYDQAAEYTENKAVDVGIRYTQPTHGLTALSAQQK